jgi:hypothetical protein
MSEKIWYDPQLDRIFTSEYYDNLLVITLPDGLQMVYDFQNGSFNLIGQIHRLFENAINVGNL